MRAAANAFTVGIEQNDLDAGNPVMLQRLADLQPQPLDQIAGGELPDIAAGIGIPELQRQPPGLLQIRPIVWTAERFFQHRRTLLQRLRRFEQGRNLDVFLDAEQPSEPERGE
ncbi:hypothetical protein GALL_536650 [mine drainage metagenome]|uniref:Uncharacterized protein n=1 Tax=mine drainage metagenome TaxID=410659 RepID=A0A1J5PAE5_9ZZZZ